MADVINVDWLNENAFRNYPIVDGASRVAASGAVLPNGLLVDISIPVPLGALDPSRAFVRRVYGFSAGVVITIGDTANPGVDLAAATVFTADHTRGRSYPLSGVPGTALEGSVGRVTVGLPEAVAQCSMGLFDFAGSPGNTRLVVSCVRPLLKGISGVIVRASNGDVATVVSGTLTLKAGDNVSIDYEADTQLVTVSSRVTATSSELAEAGCGCDETIEGPRAAIRTINGLPPDVNGNFTIEGRKTTVVEALSSGTGISIHDDSVDPCCGCEQLGEIRDDLQSIENTRTQLLTVAEQLQARIANLSSVLANAGLNPPSTPPTSATPDCWWYLPVGGGGYGSVVVPCT